MTVNPDRAVQGDPPRDPDWSPDGSLIVCGTYPPNNFDVRPGELYTLKPEGSDLHLLTKYGTNGPRAAHPRFTPDGKTILFIRASTQAWDTPPRHVAATPGVLDVRLPWASACLPVSRHPLPVSRL